jgi:hypothetical protein
MSSCRIHAREDPVHRVDRRPLSRLVEFVVVVRPAATALAADDPLGVAAFEVRRFDQDRFAPIRATFRARVGVKRSSAAAIRFRGS